MTERLRRRLHPHAARRWHAVPIPITFDLAEAMADRLSRGDPVAGLTKPDDVDRYIRIRRYEASLLRYPPDTAMLSLRPLAPWMGGSREATWHAIIRKNHGGTPPRQRQGCTLLFAGLSGSGKSTIANALLVKLLELGGRRVTLLDGEVVRKDLSSELGFSREHRDLNVRRIGYVASEITKKGGDLRADRTV